MGASIHLTIASVVSLLWAGEIIPPRRTLSTGLKYAAQKSAFLPVDPLRKIFTYTVSAILFKVPLAAHIDL
jgi:hypothetical protein